MIFGSISYQWRFLGEGGGRGPGGPWPLQIFLLQPYVFALGYIFFKCIYTGPPTTEILALSLLATQLYSCYRNIMVDPPVACTCTVLGLSVELFVSDGLGYSYMTWVIHL